MNKKKISSKVKQPLSKEQVDKKIKNRKVKVNSVTKQKPVIEII